MIGVGAADHCLRTLGVAVSFNRRHGFQIGEVAGDDEIKTVPPLQAVARLHGFGDDQDFTAAPRAKAAHQAAGGGACRTVIETDEIKDMYRDLDAIWDDRAERLNKRLADENLPVRVANLSTIWTVTYTQPSRYNWMLQYYLRAEGLALSWVGTGRFIFSLNYTEADFQAVADKLVAAARAMQGDGFWWSNAALSNKAIKRGILREMILQRI